MRTSGIYMIKNTANGKVYIGSSVSIQARWERHIRDLERNKHSNSYLQAAWNKYGKNAFSLSVLEVVPEMDGLLDREQHWLDTHLPFAPLGYNLYKTAGSPLGSKHTEATKKVMSEKRRGRTQPLEIREKIRRSLTGRSFSEEHRRNISSSQKGMSSEARSRITGMKGKTHSPETRAKMSKSRKSYCESKGASK